jgi:hypothetical protein
MQYYRIYVRIKSGGQAISRLAFPSSQWRSDWSASVLVPRLAPRCVESPPFSPAYSASSALDADVDVELQYLLRQIYLQFRELHLRILLTDLKSSILPLIPTAMH